MKRVYSLNLASFLKMKGYKYKIYDDEERKLKYFVFNEDLSKEIEEYKNNNELQDFIKNFKDIKREAHM